MDRRLGATEVLTSCPICDADLRVTLSPDGIDDLEASCGHEEEYDAAMLQRLDDRARQALAVRDRDAYEAAMESRLDRLRGK
jgi:hypothetical protein